MRTNSLLHAVRRARPTAPALMSPQQSISWSYGELDLKIRKLAGGLREIGVKTGTVVVSDIPNVAENLLLQLALSHLGASVATIKDASALAQLQSKYTVVGAVPKDADSWLTSTKFLLPPVLLSGNPSSPSSLPRALAFTSIADAPPDTRDTTAESQSQGGILGIYGGVELTHATSIALGEDASKHLGLTADDRCCVSITLFHAFGMGTAVGGALLSGAAVVLPAVGGIRGCGNPVQRADLTALVLQSTNSTILFADTHTFQALPPHTPSPPSSSPSSLQQPDKEKKGRVSPMFPHLRGGVVKTGSGSEFLPTAGFYYGDIHLKELGKSTTK